MVDRPLGTVGVEDFQAVALCFDIIAHRLQRFGGPHGEQSGRLVIAVDAVSHEVIGRVITDFENDIRHGLRNMHESGRCGFRRASRAE